MPLAAVTDYCAAAVHCRSHFGYDTLVCIVCTHLYVKDPPAVEQKPEPLYDLAFFLLFFFLSLSFFFDSISGSPSQRRRMVIDLSGSWGG